MGDACQPITSKTVATGLTKRLLQAGRAPLRQERIGAAKYERDGAVKCASLKRRRGVI